MQGQKIQLKANKNKHKIGRRLSSARRLKVVEDLHYLQSEENTQNHFIDRFFSASATALFEKGKNNYGTFVILSTPNMTVEYFYEFKP